VVGLPIGLVGEDGGCHEFGVGSRFCKCHWRKELLCSKEMVDSLAVSF
jgi:hypothetical protein